MFLKTNLNFDFCESYSFSTPIEIGNDDLVYSNDVEFRKTP